MTTIHESGSRATAMANARARATDPDTSHAAAASIDVNKSQAAVLNLFQSQVTIARFTGDDAEGFTDEAMVGFMERRLSTPFSPSRLRTARRELCDLGLIEPSGDRRPTKRGRLADVYRLTERGLTFVVPS